MNEKEINKYATIATNHYYHSKTSSFTLLDWLKAKELIRTNEDVKKRYNFLVRMQNGR